MSIVTLLVSLSVTAAAVIDVTILSAIIRPPSTGLLTAAANTSRICVMLPGLTRAAMHAVGTSKAKPVIVNKINYEHTSCMQ